MRKLLLLISLGLTSLGFLTPGLANAGHGYDQNLINAAKKLDYAAKHLYKDLHYQSGYGRVAEGAQSFSRAASRFCDKVAYGRRGRELWNEYARLARRFERLSYAVGHENRHIRREFNQVARAFNYVSQSMNQRRSYNSYDRHNGDNGYRRNGYNRYDDKYRRNQRSRSRFYLSWNR